MHLGASHVTTTPRPDPTTAHRPVLLTEVRTLLAPRRGGLVIDCTVGMGGHAEALLEVVGPSGRVLGLDRDAESLREAARRLTVFGDCFVPVHADFRDLANVLLENGTGDVDGLLADLGISSFQIDAPERGFSFTADGPLDMRMDRSRGETAASLIEKLPEKELARILREYGEEPAARRVARLLARERVKHPIRSTLQLAELVERAARGRRGARIHPATRTFQALRIAVNRELEGLDRFVEQACGSLAPGARAAFITFHSLEDRIVKRAILSLTRRCVCPPLLPRCVCGTPGIVERITRKAVRPGEAEIRANPRSRSARLRVVQRLAHAPADGGEAW